MQIEGKTEVNPETVAKLKSYAATVWDWLKKPVPAWACAVTFVVGWLLG